MGASSFNDMEIDAIGEIMNISLGASATAVSTMLGEVVSITTPIVKILNENEFDLMELEPAIGVEVAYTEGLEGSNIMMFSRNDVRIIVGTLMGTEIPKESFELDEINRSAICEVMNQMIGSSATALSEFLGFPINISTPILFEVADGQSFKNTYFSTGESKVVVRFSLEVEGKLKTEFINIMSPELAKYRLEPFGISFEQMQERQQSMPEQKPVEIREELTAPAPMDQSAADPLTLQLLGQMQQSQMQMMELMRDMKAKEKPHSSEASVIRPINMMRLEDGLADGVEEYANQEMLMNIPLEVSVEIGRTKKRVKEILEFTQGSLVVLDKMAGEQADLYVNGQCIARGDVVVVEDNFGIRITEIVARNLNPESL
ncbi:MAG: flagellar motor switch phosphatase FliY [Lachnospiraceae bacterium]